MGVGSGARFSCGSGLARDGGLTAGHALVDCVHIHCCGNGHLGFRPDGGSLLRSAKVSKTLFAPPLGASLRLGMPERRHCSVGPLRNTCVRPAWLTGRRDQRPPRGGLIADLVLGDRVSPVGASSLPQFFPGGCSQASPSPQIPCVRACSRRRWVSLR